MKLFLRYTIRLFWIAALLVFAAATLPLLINKLFHDSEAGKNLLNRAISNYAPNLKITYDTIALHPSLVSTFVEARNVTLFYQQKEILTAAKIRLWLGDKIRIAVDSPEANIAVIGALGTANIVPSNDEMPPIIVRAKNARLLFDEPPLTLAPVNFAIQYDNNRWQLSLSETPDTHILRIRAAFNHNLHGVWIAEFSGTPPAYAPLTWQHADITLQAKTSNRLAVSAAGSWTSKVSTLQQPVVVNFSTTGQYDDNNDNWTLNKGKIQTALDGITLFFNVSGSGDKSGATLAAVAVSVKALPLTAVVPHIPNAKEWISSDITLNLSGVGVWEKQADGWVINGKQVRVFNNDTAMTASLFLAGTTTQLSLARINGQIGKTPLTAIKDYLPAGEVRDWFTYAITGGMMTNADFHAAFAGETLKAARLTAVFTDGALRIDDGWPITDSLAGVVIVNNDDIRIEGEGLYGNLPVNDVIATIPAAAADKATLFLDISSAANSLVRMINMAKQTPAIADDVDASLRDLTISSGRAQLSLAVNVPLAVPEKSQATAVLLIKHANVHPRQTPPLDNISGTLHIDNQMANGKLIGQFVNKHLTAPKITVVFNNTAMTVNGDADIAVIMSIAGLPDLPAAGTLHFNLIRSPAATVFLSDLQSVSISLPSPIGKTTNIPASLSVYLTPQQTLVAYHNTDDILRANFINNGADIALNTPLIPPLSNNINIHGNGNHINLDKWLAVNIPTNNKTPTAFRLTLQNAILLNWSHPQLLVLSTVKVNGERIIELNTDDLKANITVAGNRINAHLPYLQMPSNTVTATVARYFPQQLTLSLSVAVLVSDEGLTLGAAAVTGEPSGDKWRLSTLRLQSGKSVLNAAGFYDGELTNLSLFITSPDVPELLKIYGLPSIIGEGQLSLFGSIAWPKSPIDFSKETLKGLLRLSAKDLRYLEISPSSGIVNLLAVFSPQSLISFGFTDIMKSGVAFQTIDGDIALEHGVASSDGINLVSNDLQMNIHGKTDFIHKQHDLAGRVRPGEKLLRAAGVVGIGTGAIILDPLSLLTGPIIDELFGDTLSEIGAYEYTITGDWDSPVYRQIITTPKTDLQKPSDNSH